MAVWATVKDRYDFLIANNFYYNAYEQYTLEQIEGLHKLAYSIPFEFQSFMAAQKFFEEYALQTDDKSEFLEDYQQHNVLVALYIAQGNYGFATTLLKHLMKQNYQPATPTYMNAGRARRGEMVSCFLLGVDDSLNSIGFNINTAMQLSKIGGGVALNLSRLRSRGEQIKGIDNAASGVLPVMKLLEDSFSYANQLGQRKGAGAGYLHINHWDCEEFLNSKKINADEKTRIKSLSIGLIIPDTFMEKVMKNEEHFVFAPYTVFKEYGVHLEDMNLSEMHDELVANPRIKKKSLGSARDFLLTVSLIQLNSGYPYLVFVDNANNQHALPEIGSIKMSNLCTEIFQIQEYSDIKDYGEKDEINRDINCNLGSLNIVNVMENGDFEEAVYAAIESLTAVSDLSNIKNAPTVKKANEELHSIGLGAMNLHGFLAKNKIGYLSEEAKDFARTFFMMLNYYSIKKSMLIAWERGESFKDFEKSDYANGKYFTKYIETDFSPKTKKVQDIFENAGMIVPDIFDWQNLAKDVETYGMYNAYRCAIAPTQSIGYVQNSTQSVMPSVGMVEARTTAKATTYFPMPYLAKETIPYYMQSAFDMDQFKLIDLIAEIVPHIDQGISTILYVNSDVAPKDLVRYYVYAWKKGLKSLYYTRTRKLGVDDCLACTV